MKQVHVGAHWEIRFQNRCRVQGIACTRIPDGCKQVAPQKLIRVKSPWDFVLSFRGITALIDTKTTTGSAFSHSKIDPSQVLNMFEHEAQGIRAGYVIELKETQTVIFVPSSILRTRFKAGKRGSIEPNDPGVKTLSSQGTLDARLIFQEPQALAAWMARELTDDRRNEPRPATDATIR